MADVPTPAPTPTPTPHITSNDVRVWIQNLALNANVKLHDIQSVAITNKSLMGHKYESGFGDESVFAPHMILNVYSRDARNEVMLGDGGKPVTNGRWVPINTELRAGMGDEEVAENG